ncbi:MAG TPA: type II secretion system F family protein [Candidatus Paceibacterota bacterium]|nr:type II secretion system F family protein [Candidatus Paceibacterota bacterium]HMP19047.1 type II secretion system F family protein [Candidatus Paceibacterota bacterium]HMP85188.1 type II secretion system F family protein [Candidatus Paceibacterota bacterium]
MVIKFNYKAINQNGELIIGTKESENEFSLSKELKSEKLSLISAEPVSKFGLKSVNEYLKSFGRISEHDKIIMYRNLGAMINAGLPLTRALAVMQRQAKNKKLKSILEIINDKVKKGSSLSDALGTFPKIFTSLMISMIKAGEESGNLVQSLKVTAEQMEKNYLLKKKVKGAMIYPAVIIGAMILIGFFMLIYVVPTLTSTFAELNIELPASTKFIIALSDFFQNNLIVVIILIFLIFTLFSFILKTKDGKKYFHLFLIKSPLISPLVKEINSARTTRTLSALLGAGVPFTRSLEITREVIQNVYYKKVIEKAEKNIQMGLPISKVFSENDDLFPAFVGEMMAVGEETGEMGNMLLEVADFYESEVDQKTKNISTIIEPVLMVLVGVVVGFFAISMIGPMYSLVEGI